MDDFNATEEFFASLLEEAFQNSLFESLYEGRFMGMNIVVPSDTSPSRLGVDQRVSRRMDEISGQGEEVVEKQEDPGSTKTLEDSEEEIQNDSSEEVVEEFLSDDHTRPKVPVSFIVIGTVVSLITFISIIKGGERLGYAVYNTDVDTEKQAVESVTDTDSDECAVYIRKKYTCALRE